MEEDWLLYSITLFTFTVIFLFCYIRHVFTFFERNRIPKATHPSFPFGNISDVIFQKTPMFMQLWKYYNRFKRKKCKLGGFYVFLKPAVMITDSRITESVLSTSNGYFQVGDSPKNNVADEELSDKLLAKIPKSVQEIWSNICSHFQDEVINFTVLMNQKFVDMNIGKILNLKMSQWPKENLHESQRKSIFSIFRKIIAVAYPQFKDVCRKSDKLYEDLLNEAIKDTEHNDDIVQILTQESFSIDEIKDVILGLIYNLKKSNNLVLLTLYELTVNKEIQEDLRGEIMRFRKIKSTFNYNEISELNYLETVICETLRKYPLNPFLYGICKENYSENDINLPKDVLVFVSTFGIHHDVQNYVNPEHFDPDRFSEENEKFIESSKYLPFGCKNKNDFDARYVKLMMKLTLVELLSRFKFSLGKKSPTSIQFDEASFESLKLKEDLWLKIRKL